jgi:hypothetical protein
MSFKHHCQQNAWSTPRTSSTCVEALISTSHTLLWKPTVYCGSPVASRRAAVMRMARTAVDTATGQHQLPGTRGAGPVNVKVVFYFLAADLPWGPSPTSAEALPVCLPGEALPRGTDARAKPSAAPLPRMETDSGLKTSGPHPIAAPLRSDHELACPDPFLLCCHRSKSCSRTPLRKPSHETKTAYSPETNLGCLDQSLGC